MSEEIPRPLGTIALVATLLVSGVGITVPASAEDCLGAPNSPAPQGSHWYYRLDWATQRKCWYARAPGPIVQQAAVPVASARITSLHSVSAASEPISAADGAPMSVSPGDGASPSPHVKIPAVKPKSARAITTTDRTVQRSVNDENIAPSTMETPAPQVSASSQSGAQAVGPAPAAPMAWPDAPPTITPTKPQELIAAPTDSPSDGVSVDAEQPVRGDKPNDNTGMPMIIFPILALGLTVVALFIKIAAARRTRTIINRSEPSWVDDQGHNSRDDQHGSVDERREYRSLISAISGPFGVESGTDQMAHKISKRRDKLALLHQDLDRLLQSPTSA